MKTLFEALIGKHNEEKAVKYSKFKCFIVCPGYHDRKWLENSKYSFLMKTTDKGYHLELYFLNKNQIHEFMLVSKNVTTSIWGCKKQMSEIYKEIKSISFIDTYVYGTNSDPNIILINDEDEI